MFVVFMICVKLGVILVYTMQSTYYSDNMIIIETVGPKELLRFVYMFSRKFSRKCLVFRSGGRLFFEYRRRVGGDLYSILIMSPARILKGVTSVTYAPHRNKIILRPKMKAGVWRVNIVDVIERIGGQRGSKVDPLRCHAFRALRFVDVVDFEDLIYYSFYVRDIIMLMCYGDGCVMLTGFMSNVFPSVEPSLYIFRSILPYVPQKRCYIDISASPKFTDSIAGGVKRFVALVNIKGMVVYAAEKERIGDDTGNTGRYGEA